MIPRSTTTFTRHSGALPCTWHNTPVRRTYVLNFCLVLLSVAFATSCASTKRLTETGIASWYGPGFHGKTTANGETYNQNEMTAAHKTLPFNTMVRVTNLDNGKQVTVRINDRGPYVRGRVIDLSLAAARRLEMEDTGVARVRLEIMRSDTPITKASMAKEAFTVQIASYTVKSQADAKAKGVKGAWVHEAVVDGRTYYRVYVGRFDSRDKAERELTRLARQGEDGFVKQVQN